jgi:hypothetical protein
MEEGDVLRFSAIRRLILMFKYSLNILEDLKKEHDLNLENIQKSLIDHEVFLKEKYNIDVELLHLANHVDFLNETKMNTIRKQILDYGNNLRREME